MGAWGVDAFANDYALDDVELLTSKAGVLGALDKLLALVDGEEDEWFVHTGYGAAEVVAAASVAPYYQSEGTTLLAGGAGTPYLPEEIADWLAQERPRFTRAEIEAAIAAVDILRLPELVETWSAPAARLAALDETRLRLVSGLSGAPVAD